MKLYAVLIQVELLHIIESRIIELAPMHFKESVAPGYLPR
jgi:hypothetical protein